MASRISPTLSDLLARLITGKADIPVYSVDASAKFTPPLERLQPLVAEISWATIEDIGYGD